MAWNACNVWWQRVPVDNGACEKNVKVLVRADDVRNLVPSTECRTIQNQPGMNKLNYGKAFIYFKALAFRPRRDSRAKSKSSFLTYSVSLARLGSARLENPRFLCPRCGGMYSLTTPQVQPFSVWDWHLRSRGLSNTVSKARWTIYSKSTSDIKSDVWAATISIARKGASAIIVWLIN